MEIRALVVHEQGTKACLETVELDDPGPGEVLVRISASGVCASDAHVINGRSPLAKSPTVLGHEGAGTVTAVGPDVSTLGPGDHVVIGLYAPCWSCSYCVAGRPWLCDGKPRMLGFLGTMADGGSRVHLNGRDLYPFLGAGTLAEYAVVRAGQAVKVDPELPMDEICLTGCGVATGVGAALNTAHVEPGSTVFVAGCGGVGLSVIQGARIAGATTIIAYDVAAPKLALAKDFGATHVLESNGPLVDAVRGIAPGGVDYAFEVVGIPDLVTQCVALLRHGGTCVVVGSCPPGSFLSGSRESMMMERRLMTTAGGSSVPERDIPRLLAMYRTGQLRLRELVSQGLAFDDFQLAFDAIEDGTVARSVIAFE
jgi:S-(hydroxymethyl)glutathione dehydrogenase/alcohol dehydrogenase